MIFHGTAVAHFLTLQARSRRLPTLRDVGVHISPSSAAGPDVRVLQAEGLFVNLNRKGVESVKKTFLFGACATVAC